tara:strand:- start:428 stop:1465 length:1038 start_codon:yes stop_codon:yes gene_type:complete
MYNYIKNFINSLFSSDNVDNSNDTILDLKISNNINISKQPIKIEKPIIRRDLFDNNYYFKYLFTTDNDEYKFCSMQESVNKDFIIHKKNLVRNSTKLFKHIYLNNKHIYKSCYYNNKQSYIHIIRYLKNNKIPNIILPEEIYEEMLSASNSNTKKILQIIPYKKYGDLFTYVTSNKFKHYEIYAIFYKLVSIIKDLHTLNVSHRDIKLENILIDFLPNLELYLIDFEFANHYSDYSRFYGGTEQYAAPELFSKNKKINNYKCVDIWALGVVLYILIFNIMPWKVANTNICEYYYNFVADPMHFYNSLDTINIPSTHKLIYTKILKYCFNLNHTKRTDINYIFNLL